MGLEAKDLVEAAPKPVLEKVNKETADKAREALEAAGATVSLQVATRRECVSVLPGIERTDTLKLCMGAATKVAVTNQPCRPTSQQDGGPHILVPRRLEYAEDVDASVEAPENLLAWTSLATSCRGGRS